MRIQRTATLTKSEHYEWIGPSEFRLRSEYEDELTTGDEMAMAERSGRRTLM